MSLFPRAREASTKWVQPINHHSNTIFKGHKKGNCMLMSQTHKKNSPLKSKADGKLLVFTIYFLIFQTQNSL